MRYLPIADVRSVNSIIAHTITFHQDPISYLPIQIILLMFNCMLRFGGVRR